MKRHYANVCLGHDANGLPVSAQSDMERTILPSAKWREQKIAKRRLKTSIKGAREGALSPERSPQ